MAPIVSPFAPNGRHSGHLTLRASSNDSASALIFDGRNLYDPQYMVALEIEYYAIGRGRSVQLSD